MKILVLNDTRSENHHGCSRVMNAIDRNLFIRGVEDICYFKLMLRWDLDEDLKKRKGQLENIKTCKKTCICQHTLANVDLFGKL